MTTDTTQSNTKPASGGARPSQRPEGVSAVAPASRPARPAEQERGVVIILALAVLAIIALAAVSYMTAVRTDRASSVLMAERMGYERQPAVVIDHMGALLTADLFGQKIVTADVPRLAPNNTDYPNWPRPFEDGNQWDYPHADPWFLQNENDGRELRATEQLPQDRIAQPSQPWLASTEPLWDLTSGLNNTKVWLQVTNLRSGYRWDSNAGNGGAWVRNDGKFADLMQFFAKSVDDGGVRRGNAKVDFLGLTSTPTANRGAFVGPVGGVHFPGVGAPTSYNPSNPFSAQSQESTAVWGYPMTDFTLLSDDADTGPGVLDHADERLWVDTDGDGYADARWQVLEGLGDYGGLRWFTAARIIDASGLVNYNTALEFSYAGHNLAPTVFGANNKVGTTLLDRDPRGSTGRTPADVDLFGLVYEMSGGTSTDGLDDVFDTGPDTDKLPVRNNLFTFGGNPNQGGNNGVDAFEDHLYNGLGLRAFFASVDTLADEIVGDPLQPAEADAPTFFNPGSGGFGGGNTWRTKASGVPSINGLPSIPSYTQVVHPLRGLPDHALSMADPNDGGLTTMTDSAANNPLPTLTQSQRRAFYELGVLPGDSGPFTSVRRYPLTDLIDLRSFYGTNTDDLSQIERRFDGPQGAEGNGRGVAYLPDGGLADDLVLGPMRSRQPSLSAMLAGETPAKARPTPEQIYHDLRRLLTPHSGAAPFSVVPVLNPAHPAFQSGALQTKPVVTRPFITDAQVSDLFAAYVWALAPQAARLGQATFGSPVVPVNWRGDYPLPYTTPTGAMANPASPEGYYGGGSNAVDGINLPGPALRLWNNGSGFLAQPVGASYALRAALAMTVNTITAANNGSGATNQPAIVRFYPAGEQMPAGAMLPLTATGATQPEPVPGVTVHSVAGRFPFGDLPEQAANPQMLPTIHLGTADSGITAVGLQRQPFLIGAYSLAVYENARGVMLNTAAGATTSVTIDPMQADDRFGSIFAIEVGNPWDTPISMAGYEARVQVGKLSPSLDAACVRINLSSDQPIEPGQRRIYYVVTSNQLPGAQRVDQTMALIRDAWLADLSPDVERVAIDETLGSISDRVIIESPDPAALATDGILFNRLTLDEITQTPVLLVRRLSGEFTDVPEQRGEVLVDRMTPNYFDGGLGGGGGDTPPFPAFYSTREPTLDLRFTKPAGFGATPPGAGPRYLFVRVTRESEVRRPSLNGLNTGVGYAGGFPAYVIERPSQNKLRVDDITDADIALVAQTFSNFGDPADEENPPGPFETNDTPNSSYTRDTALSRFGRVLAAGNPDDLLHFNDQGDLPFAEPFELYVPINGLASKADVLRLTAFAHMYRPAGPMARAVSVSRGNAAFSNFLLDNIPYNNYTGVPAPGIVALPTTAYWLTVSEQLGMDANLYLGTAGAPVAVNPYFHVLNPLRDHRQAPNNSSTSRVADALTIPPAVRLLDAIEVFETSVGVIPGRININNAPDQVLKAIPLLMPRRDLAAWSYPPYEPNQIASAVYSPMNGGGSSGERFMEAFTGTRVETLASYRDRYNRSSSPLPNSIGVNAFAGLTDMGALYRQPGGWRDNQPRGIVSIGELANLHQWRVGGGINPDGSSAYFSPMAGAAEAQRGFAEIGVNPFGGGRVPNFGTPFEVESLGELGIEALPSNVYGAPGSDLGVSAYAKPADDVNERLAIFRAMSNIIETRSDVFLATFVVRGYRPSVIESIRVTDTDNAAAALAMNSEAFRPEHESRWLVLFDRSNVRLPTDRPKVLLKVELPPAHR